ncbi:unnamed protein product [Owenia fusiformis]|uniref:Nucleolus and neural progenitor protein-like N-terminal domain-containing protein n=1 Tax=Owenia fusiformis TaxID=6347 RepID=A0A8J1Y5Q1_OWEFU|nr:unnamed protein product [Owenia fusiformis]
MSWNQISVPLPPCATVQVDLDRLNRGMIGKVCAKLPEYLETILNQQCLSTEMFILNKLIYVANNQLRQEKCLQGLKKIHRCLKRWCHLSLNKDLDHYCKVLPKAVLATTTKLYIPSLIMTEHILLRLQGASNLLARAATYCTETYPLFLQLMENDYLIPKQLIFVSIVSRIFALVRLLLIQTVEAYQTLLPLRLALLKSNTIKNQEHDFPENILESLGADIVNLVTAKQHIINRKLYMVGVEKLNIQRYFDMFSTSQQPENESIHHDEDVINDEQDKDDNNDDIETNENNEHEALDTLDIGEKITRSAFREECEKPDLNLKKKTFKESKKSKKAKKKERIMLDSVTSMMEESLNEISRKAVKRKHINDDDDDHIGAVKQKKQKHEEPIRESSMDNTSGTPYLETLNFIKRVNSCKGKKKLGKTVAKFIKRRPELTKASDTEDGEGHKTMRNKAIALANMAFINEKQNDEQHGSDTIVKHLNSLITDKDTWPQEFQKHFNRKKQLMATIQPYLKTVSEDMNEIVAKRDNGKVTQDNFNITNALIKQVFIHQIVDDPTVNKFFDSQQSKSRKVKSSQKLKKLRKRGKK